MTPEAVFSILERIDVGETARPAAQTHPLHRTFSILERIDVGETRRAFEMRESGIAFQYPRTDRRG